MITCIKFLQNDGDDTQLCRISYYFIHLTRFCCLWRYMSFAGGGGRSSSSLSSPPKRVLLRLDPTLTPSLLSSTIQCTDFAKSNSFVSHPLSATGNGAT